MSLVIIFLLNFSYGIEVKITWGIHGKKLNLGIAPMVLLKETFEEKKISQEVSDIIKRDLAFSRYFDIVEGGPDVYNKDFLTEWKKLGCEVIFQAKVKKTPDTIYLFTELIDVESNSTISKKEFSKITHLREVAHNISDYIVESLTAEKGIAHTKIAFVNDWSGYKEIYVIDYDGYNLRKITNDKSIALLPRWSPDNKWIAYTSYKNGNPDMYFVSLDGKNIVVSQIQGLNIPGSWSSDGGSILTTLSIGKDPEIYLISTNGEILRRLTFFSGIDTSPCFSPSGTEFVFVSDRPGLPQLYVSDLYGGNLRRLTFEGYCDSPRWSPKGDKIVYSASVAGDSYNIFVMTYPEKNIKQLTFGSNNENASWSPDGRFIVFSTKRFGRRQLFIMPYDGSFQFRIGDIPGNSYYPDWSN